MAMRSKEHSDPHMKKIQPYQVIAVLLFIAVWIVETVIFTKKMGRMEAFQFMAVALIYQILFIAVTAFVIYKDVGYEKVQKYIWFSLLFSYLVLIPYLALRKKIKYDVFAHLLPFIDHFISAFSIHSHILSLSLRQNALAEDYVIDIEDTTDIQVTIRDTDRYDSFTKGERMPAITEVGLQRVDALFYKTFIITDPFEISVLLRSK